MMTLRTSFLAVFLFVPALVNAQWHGPDIPDSLSFQGFLTDTSGTVVADGDYDLLFKMYKGATKVWEQNQLDVAVKSGGFNVILGSVASPLDTVAFNEAIDLGITVDGGTEMTPRTPLTSAAYALGMRGMYAVWADDGTRKAPNLIGGASNNFVASGVVGATIGGGGGWFFGIGVPDSVLQDWATVSGGRTNTASGEAATVGGGASNTASGLESTVGGGVANTAIGTAATVGGGSSNTAVGKFATVPGGRSNTASKGYSFAAGQNALADHSGTFVWADSVNNVGGIPFISTAANQFLIRAVGGVGIGTNAPTEALHIKEASGSTGLFLGGGGTAGPHGIIFDDDTSGAGVQLLWRTDPNRLILERSSGGTGVDGSDAFFYDRDDDVFGFDGIVRPMTDNTHALGAPSQRWSIVYAAGGVVTTSDGRLKQGVEDIDAGLKTVLGLRPVRYQWTDGPDQEHHLGLIAQEVEKVVPEVVAAPNSEDGYYGVNYGELVPVLIKAIQELSASVESQREMISELHAAMTN